MAAMDEAPAMQQPLARTVEGLWALIWLLSFTQHIWAFF